MPNIVITNISSEPVFLRDFYVELVPGATTNTFRTSDELMAASGLHELLEGGKVSLSITFTPEEQASNFNIFPGITPGGAGVSGWAPATTYTADDLVVSAGALWRRKTDGTSGSTFNLDERFSWTKLTPDETILSETVFVDGATGSDVTGTGSASSPVATIAAAYSRLPDRILPGFPQDVEIVDDTSPYDAAPFTRDVVLAPVGLSGRNLVTEVLGSTAAQTGTGAAAIVTALTFSTTAGGEHRGFWIEILTGSGAGALMQIAWNDADTLYPVRPFGQLSGTFVPDNTSTFRIVRPRVVIQGPDIFADPFAGVVLADRIGAEVASTFGPGGAATGIASNAGLHLHMLILDAESGLAVFLVNDSRLSLWAVEQRTSTFFNMTKSSQVLAGVDATLVSGGALGPFELGWAAGKDAFSGAGLIAEAGSTPPTTGSFKGYVCGFALLSFGDGSEWLGGSTHISAAGSGVINFGSGRMSAKGTNTTRIKVFIDSATARGFHGVSVSGGAEFFLTFFEVVYGAGTTNGIGLLAWTQGNSIPTLPGVISVGHNVFVNGGPAFLGVAMNGGRIYTWRNIQHDTTPSVADWGILPVQVTDTATATAENSTFADGDSIIDAARFSIILRAS